MVKCCFRSVEGSVWRLNFDLTHPEWAPWRDGHVSVRRNITGLAKISTTEHEVCQLSQLPYSLVMEGLCLSWNIKRIVKWVKAVHSQRALLILIWPHLSHWPSFHQQWGPLSGPATPIELTSKRITWFSSPTVSANTDWDRNIVSAPKDSQFETPPSHPLSGELNPPTSPLPSRSSSSF